MVETICCGGWLVSYDRAIEKVLVQCIKLRSPYPRIMRPLRNAMALAGLVTQCTKALCFRVNHRSLLLVSSLQGLRRQPVLIKFSFLYHVGYDSCSAVGV